MRLILFVKNIMVPFAVPYSSFSPSWINPWSLLLAHSCCPCCLTSDWVDH